MVPGDNNYEDILALFGKDKFKARFAFLADKANAWIQHIVQNCGAPEETFRVSHSIVEEVVLDYFADIARLKDFHSIEKTHPQKVAAYTAYWTFRRKPIQIVKDIQDRELRNLENIKYLNESFAASLLLTMAYDTRRRRGDIDYDRYITFVENLNYFLTYRAVNPQVLELILITLDANSPYFSLNDPD